MDRINNMDEWHWMTVQPNLLCSEDLSPWLGNYQGPWAIVHEDGLEVEET